MRYVVIMAGGSGRRLWPLSRQGEPKQLLPLFDGQSLLQLAHQRVLRVVGPEQVLVCTGAGYADVVLEQLPGLLPENLLGEPEGRDSLNAVAWPAAVLARRDPDAVVAMVTADQLINPVDTFADALDAGFRLATELPDVLVTFGVLPTSAHTGYGYLARGADIDGYGTASWVTEFKEKPDLATAQAYLASGDYWWNAGMFVWRARTLLDQLAVLLPQTHAKVLQLAQQPNCWPRRPTTAEDLGRLRRWPAPAVRARRGSAIALDIDWPMSAASPHAKCCRRIRPATRWSARWWCATDREPAGEHRPGSVLAVAGAQDWSWFAPRRR